MLVDMSLNVELGRLIRDKAAWLYDQGRPSGKISSMSKLVCSEGARKNADFCVQIFGGMGFMDDCVASRYFRDARGLTLADGTSEAQKMTIARALTR
jgi:alkylation response protein AidB-like acyl-CoA dehydrogenase